MYLLKNLFNNCPKCSSGRIFRGIVEVNRNCNTCKTNFHIDKIGDAASWLTTFFLSIVALPIAFLIDLKLKFTLIELAFSISFIILLLALPFLRISKYFLIIKLIKLEYAEKKK